jgi:superfamily I DNA/RNA helicase
MPSERVIWGPPGTGKTSAGITLARHWTDQGVAPSGIAYLAFTKAAAKAASLKIFATEDDTKMGQEFPYFRTIHSLCYLGLRKHRHDVRMVSTGDMKQFAKTMSMDGMYAIYDWEDLAEVYAKMEDRGRTEWDQALSAYTFTRVKARTVEELERAKYEPSKEGALMLGFESMKMDVYREFVEKYEKFKKADGLIDFTDMLEYGVTEMPPFDDVRYVVIDEAQDLAPLHHAIIDRLLGNAEEIWWIGDDDQAIFKFSGASAELFLDRARRARIQHQLRQTHRFGQKIVDFSNQIIRRVKERHPKEILGVSGRDGKIEVTGEFQPIPGDVMILHRHVQGCQNVAQAYIEAGIPFRNERGRDPLDSMARIKGWEAIQSLAKGEGVTMSTVALLVEDLLPSTVVIGDSDKKITLVVRGAKSKLEEKVRGVMTLKDLIEAKILTPEGASVIQEKEYSTMRHSEDLVYFDRVVKNGYSLDPDGKMPRITTIHGAKGRQAERAVVFTEMGGKCWEDADTEHRLAYVAATRTQTDVTICHETKVHWAKDVYNYPVDEEAVV